MVWAVQSFTTRADVPQYSIPDGLVTLASADFSTGPVCALPVVCHHGRLGEAAFEHPFGKHHQRRIHCGLTGRARSWRNY